MGLRRWWDTHVKHRDQGTQVIVSYPPVSCSTSSKLQSAFASVNHAARVPVVNAPTINSSIVNAPVANTPIGVPTPPPFKSKSSSNVNASYQHADFQMLKQQCNDDDDQNEYCNSCFSL